MKNKQQQLDLEDDESMDKWLKEKAQHETDTDTEAYDQANQGKKYI